MRKRNNSKYKFYFKKVTELTKNEKNQMMNLMVVTYPKYRELYIKNKYYSTVKPQMEHLIKQKGELVGLGKFLWRKVKIGVKFIKFFAFGIRILKKHQGKGLGTKLIKKDILEAKKRGADILYCSTANIKAEHVIAKLGFKKLNTPVFYKNTKTGKIQKEKDNVWVYEFNKGIINKIENLKKFYIGTGSL